MTPDLLARIKAVLSIADTSKDAAITMVGDAALQSMRKVTARVLYPVHEVRETFLPPQGCSPASVPPLWLSQLPVVEILEVKEGGGTTDVADLVATPTGRVLRAATAAPVAVGAGVQVTYRAGYAELPADLFAALVELCRRGLADPGGTVRKVSVVDVGSIEYADTGSAGADPVLGDWIGTVESYASLANTIGAHPFAEVEVRGVSGDQSVPGGQQPPAAGLTQADADARYVALAGGTMTGALTLAGDPTAPLQAATKSYVDAKLTALPPATTFVGAEDFSLPIPPVQHSPGAFYFHSGADNVVVDGTWPGIAGLTVNTQDAAVFDGMEWHLLEHNLQQAQLDARYVNADGDTMSGALYFSPTAKIGGKDNDLILSGGGSTTFELQGGGAFGGGAILTRPPGSAARSFSIQTEGITPYGFAVNVGTDSFGAPSYVELGAWGSMFLQVAVDDQLNHIHAMFDVPVVLPGAPTKDDHAATKKYVDDAVAAGGGTGGGTGGLTQAQADARYVEAAGDTMSGALWIDDPGSTRDHIHMGASSAEVFADHETWGHNFGVNVGGQAVLTSAAETNKAPQTALYGQVSLPDQLPAAGGDVITKGYADAHYVNLAGGTLTGVLTVPAGTADAPGLTFGGDPVDTGLFRPVPDGIGIATGGLARFTIGNTDATFNTRRLTINGKNNGNAPGADAIAELSLKPGGSNAASVTFWTDTAGSQQGRWTLGTTKIAEDLDDGTNAGSDLALRSWGDSGAALLDHIVLSRKDGNTRFGKQGTPAAPTIALGPNNSYGINYDGGAGLQLTANSAARVTLTPSQCTYGVPILMSHNSGLGGIVLTIAGAGTALDVTQTGSGKGILVTCAGTNAGDPFTVEDSTRPDSTPFVIKNDGKVGIGTTTPGALLDVAGNIATVAPTADLHATTKKYVDDQIAALVARIAALENRP